MKRTKPARPDDARQGTPLAPNGRGLSPKAEEIAYDVFPKYVTSSDVVIEVGANIGGSTLLLSDLAKFVYAFEPNPSVFDELKRSTAARRNVEVHNLGVGAVNEVAAFNLPHPDGSTRGSRFVIEGGTYVGKIDVKIVRLDDFNFGLPPTVLVLDCEGSEIPVLEGARAMLSTGAVGKVLAEMHYLADGSDTIEPTKRKLGSFGYRTETKTAPDGSPWILARR